MVLREVLRDGKVTIIDSDDPDADELFGFHIETAEMRRKWDKKNMAPSSEAALIREIQRAFPDWEPAI